MSIDAIGVSTDLNYAELALDVATGDLAIPVKLLKGADAIAQRIRTRFRFVKGEWFLDKRLGVPYFDYILIKNPDPVLVSAIFRRVLMTTPGVKQVKRFTATLDKATRTLTVDFEALLNDDTTTLVANAEPFIIFE